ncbi:MAG: disulfide bond formation protein B, partial [Xanthobacteraceae bacterium]
MAKQSWIDRARTEPAAATALAIFIISAATLGGAWYFQLVVGLPPCPLCLEERIPYHIVIPLSLLMAIAALVRAPPKLLMVGFAAIIVAMACNVALGTYHAGVEWHWWAGPTDCTGPLTDLRAGGSLLNQLQSIHVVRCDEAAWRFLGISLAGY